MPFSHLYLLSKVKSFSVCFLLIAFSFLVVKGLASFSPFDIVTFYLVSYMCFYIKDFLVFCYISCKCISGLLFAFSFVFTDFSPWSLLFLSNFYYLESL